MRRREACFIMRHAAAAAAICEAAAAAQGAAAAALPRWRVEPRPQSCSVALYLELLELPEPSVAAALGLHESAPLRCVLSFPASALEEVCRSDEAAARMTAPVEFRQPDVERAPPAEEDEEEDEAAVVGRASCFGLDVFLPELAKDALQEWAAPHSAAAAALPGSKRPRERDASGAAATNFFVFMLQRVWGALSAATSHCAICRAPLPSPGARLAPCSRDGCGFVFEEVLACPLLPLLRESGGASAAFHVGVASAAARAHVGANNTLEPFPSFLLAAPQRRGRAGFFDGAVADAASLADNKRLGLSLLAAVLGTLPPLAELAAERDEASLRRRLRRLNWRTAPASQTGVTLTDVKAAGAQWSDAAAPDIAFRVLRFVLTSARFDLRALRDDASRLGPALSACTAQLAVLGCSEAREQRFQARRAAAGGSFYAFHGSSLKNWYSICACPWRRRRTR
jgi:ubiquitin-conjugating enzyme E2 Q